MAKQSYFKIPQTQKRSILINVKQRGEEISSLKSKNDADSYSSVRTVSGRGSQELPTTLGTIPILWSWAVKIQEEELLPDERQKRVIRRCDQSLVGPAINQQPLQGRDDRELQLGLGFLQERRGFSN